MFQVKHWTERRKIKMQRPNGGIEKITVAKMMEEFNVQNQVLENITKISQQLLISLYIEDPEHAFFKKNDKKYAEYAKKAVADIKEIAIADKTIGDAAPPATPDNAIPLKKD